ncbi:MAG TPA: DUF3829 domain-containing protein [Flavisolibacter sp.]|nr:DUF3829 domain-containing protein [Flavisolibacter sp.]
MKKYMNALLICFVIINSSCKNNSATPVANKSNSTITKNNNSILQNNLTIAYNEISREVNNNYANYDNVIGWGKGTSALNTKNNISISLSPINIEYSDNIIALKALLKTKKDSAAIIINNYLDAFDTLQHQFYAANNYYLRGNYKDDNFKEGSKYNTILKASFQNYFDQEQMVKDLIDKEETASFQKD